MVLAALLLLGECIWLVSRFTTATLPDSDASWVVLMKQAKYLPQVGLALLTALLLFRQGAAVVEPPRATPQPRPLGRWIALLLAQLAAFVLLERSTASILERHLQGVAHPLLALTGWALTGLATALLGALLFLPLPLLARQISRRAGTLLLVGLVGLAAWCAGYLVMTRLSGALRAPTLWLTDKVLGLFESDYSIDWAQFTILSPRYPVHIADECSGFEGIGLMAVFAASYVWIFRRRLRFPQLLLLPLAGIACVWLLNVVRLVALMLIGIHVSPQFADGGFHSLAGTFLFCLAAVGLFVLSNRMSFFTRLDLREQAYAEPDGTAAYLAPFLLVVALGIVAGALGPGRAGDLVQLARVLSVAGVLWHFRRRYPIALARQGWTTAVVFGVVAFALWIGLHRLGAPRAAAAPLSAPAGGLWLAIRIAESVCIAPLAEELAFRGYLMRRLTAEEFESVDPGQVSLIGWTISALVFGVLHDRWLAATLAGVLYGFAYMRRGRLIDCILAHALTNLLLIVLALATGDWSLT